MNAISREKLHRLYPAPVIRGSRVARQAERELEPFRLTADMAATLGTENIGVFIGPCASLEHAVDRLREIDRHEHASRWIVIPATRQIAADVYQRWFDSDDVWHIDQANVPDIWHGSCVTFCLIESLSKLTCALQNDRADVAGIILLDPYCMVQRARGCNNGRFWCGHDRPQMIVDFRARLAIGTWAPPLIFVSLKPARSVHTISMQRAYCLEAFYFVDGRSLRCYPLPAAATEPPVPVVQRTAAAC